MKNMKKLTCQVLAACALTTGMMLMNGGTVFAETSSGHTVTKTEGSTQSVYGGSVEITTGTGQADGNTLTVESDGTFEGNLSGGFVDISGLSSANVAIANGNTLNIINKIGTFRGAISGGYVDTKGGMAQADNNIVKIDSGTFISQSNCDITGGWARSIEAPSCVAQANGNKAEISNITTNVRFSPAIKDSAGNYTGDGFLNRNIYGGYATSFTDGTATANDNSLTISNSDIVIMPHATINRTDKGYSESVVYAGYAINGDTNVANNNTLTINGGKINGYNIDTLKTEYSEYSAYFANPEYIIEMNDATDIGGGFATNGTANNNKVIISDGTIGSTGRVINVYGANRATLAKGNEVIINGPATVTGNVAGAYTEVGNAIFEGNKVTISAGTVNGLVAGADGYFSSTIKGNEVNISGGTVEGKIYGGFGQSGSQSTVADGNKVTITGGTITGDVHGGYVDDERDTVAKNNTVIIEGGTIEGNVFGGGTWFGGSGKAFDNTVTLGAANGTGTADITGNVYINYFNKADDILDIEALPGGNLNVCNAGNKVGGNLYAEEAKINFYGDAAGARLNVSGTAYINKADVRINVKNVIDIAENTTFNLIDGSVNGTAAYTLTDGLVENVVNLTDSGAVTYSHSNNKVNESSKSPAETQIVGVALVNEGMDMMTNQGFGDAAAAVNNSGDGGRSMSPFITFGGSKMRQNSGSHVDMNSWNAGIGFAKEVANSHGKLMFGPVVEYGKGSYDSYLDDGTHGSGDSSFWGAGAIIKQENKDGFYCEGSLRAGRLKNDYKSNLLGGMSYDNSATFYAFHAGAGKVVKLNENDTMDYYGKVFYTHQNGSSATLSTGHVYNFDAINSIRTRIGFRYTHKMNKNQDVYAGLAWQHEFDSKAVATLYSIAVPAPTVKGETGILELGMKARMSDGKFESDLGFIGNIGKQKGMGFNAKFQWNF